MYLQRPSASLLMFKNGNTKKNVLVNVRESRVKNVQAAKNLDNYQEASRAKHIHVPKINVHL